MEKLDDDVRQMITFGEKIKAIKTLRERYSFDLKEARDIAKAHDVVSLPRLREKKEDLQRELCRVEEEIVRLEDTQRMYPRS